jgi:hypothetical protein
MLNRIIYALSSFEAENNFAAEINSQAYGRMPSITEEFLRNCKNKKFKVLKDNFNDFYSRNNMDPEVKGEIDKLIEEAKQFVFNKLYVDYYNRYGKGIKAVEASEGVEAVKAVEGVRRGLIKQKLKELITDGDVIEAISNTIDGIKPSTCFEKVQAMSGGCERC